MTDIIELAKKAGFLKFNVEGWSKEFETFAALVRAEVEAEWIDTNKALAKEIIELKKAKPVKQEPVAWMNKVANVFAQHPEGAKNFGCDIPLYTAPVDAKAIRAEALEEAAKVCEQGTGSAVQTDALKVLRQERERIAEAIRVLK